MEHILSGDGLRADTALGERHVRGTLGFRLWQTMIMSNNSAIGVDPARQSWIRGTWQDVEFARHLDDVRRVTAAGAFRMVGVDRPAFERRDGIFDKAAFVEGVGVDTDLHIHVVGDRETGSDGRRSRAPIFVNLEACGACQNLFDQGRSPEQLPLPRNPKLIGNPSTGPEHHFDVPTPRR